MAFSFTLLRKLATNPCKWLTAQDDDNLENKGSDENDQGKLAWGIHVSAVNGYDALPGFIL